MMRILYIVTIIICVFLLLIIYASNVMYLSIQPMYFLTSSILSVPVWLLLIILLSFILWFSFFWLITTFVKKKPKDFDEFDL